MTELIPGRGYKYTKSTPARNRESVKSWREKQKGREKRRHDMDEQPYQQQIQIDLDDVTAQGVFANLAMITHSETEFTLDFVYLQPQQPKAKVRARIISTPGHTKRFVEALVENVKKYEARYGPIKTAPEPAGEKRVGF